MMIAKLQPLLPILTRGTVLRRRFVIGRVLAQTNLSTVYLGWELHDGRYERLVAIKRLSTAAEPGGLRRRTAVHAFRQEIALLASLTHPQLPHLYAAFRQGYDYFMVMEYINGVALDTVMDRSPIAREVALAIADSLCDVVIALHRRRIIHADIKPSNVMLADDGRVVLLDLGLARRCDPRRWDNEPIGTLPYAPPEQRRGTPLDERSDLYALGVLLSELLGPAANHPILRSALDSATAPQPADRFASVRQFRRALHGEDDIAMLLRGCVKHLIPDLWTAWAILVVIASLSVLILTFGPTRISSPMLTMPTPALRVIEPSTPTPRASP